MSQGAALSCLSQDGSVLMEVVCFAKEKAPGYGQPSLVQTIADGIAKYSAVEPGMHNGRVIAQNAFPFGGAEACIDILIAYRDDAGAASGTAWGAGRGRIDDLISAQAAPVRRRGRFPRLLVGAVLAAAIWYVFLRH